MTRVSGLPPDMLEVAIVQYRLFHYRVPLFERMRHKLASRGIRMHLVVGQPSVFERARRDEGHLDWAHKVRNRFWRVGGKDLLWQPLPRVAREAALCVVIQENRILSNYVCQLRRSLGGGPMLAFWGHGRNYQSAVPDGLRERWKRLWLTRVDWWFGYTEGTRAYLGTRGFDPSRITVLNNAIDDSGFRRDLAAVTPDQVVRAREMHGIAPGAQVAIYCGSIYAEKRISVVLESADRLRESLPDFHLLVVGDGPDAGLVRQAASTRPWIHVLGIRKGLDKALAYRLSAVMLNPGLVGLHVVDSFIAGTPLVTQASAMHSPEFDYLVEGVNGRVVPGDGIEDYARAVSELFEVPERLAALRAGCARDAERYTLEAMAANFCDGIVACLRRAGHPVPDTAPG
jgi:glycosyltransferase involved in cell wall biosynthesis